MAGEDYKSSAKVRKDGQKRRSRTGPAHGRFVSYIVKILKSNSKDMTISSKALAIMNSFVMDNFTRICELASQLCKRVKSKTLTAREIQTAAKLILPGELARMACNEGAKAVANYDARTKLQ